MLAFLTIVVMLIVAYAFFREGVLTALAMACNVVLAGLMAFNFFEPIATELGPMFEGSFLQGYEDALCLVVLFSATLGLLRWATNALANSRVTYHTVVDQGGALLVGLITGYLTAGFLVCVLQTLPWQRNFMGFEARVNPSPGLRRVLPPDRVWLAMMHRASMTSFSSDPTSEFDPDGSFELRYEDKRRYPEAPAPSP
jgi:hypothetical protein